MRVDCWTHPDASDVVRTSRRHDSGLLEERPCSTHNLDVFSPHETACVSSLEVLSYREGFCTVSRIAIRKMYARQAEKEKLVD